ncbi:hypothetical protein [Acidithiobacillus ferriphilus]|uniref:hypothetical protein n=1 Tax=Acidithiobacillus ferriphilus TaxID=1689834 RepID=UPI00232A7CEE|nr:hypothetical protein [Acidithiobacillus ferriphilus]WCE92795.1 hypothetical protein PJU76_07430 [Acidithiobacillus ferriphilus]
MVKIAKLSMAFVVVYMLSGCALSGGREQASAYQGIASRQDIQKISVIPPKQSSRVVKRPSKIPNQQYRVANTPKNEAPNLDENLSAETVRFREHIKIGEQSQCGMIVNIRGAIAKVQMTDGEKWMKISDLYPANSGRACQFGADGR